MIDRDVHAAVGLDGVSRAGRNDEVDDNRDNPRVIIRILLDQYTSKEDKVVACLSRVYIVRQKISERVYLYACIYYTATTPSRDVRRRLKQSSGHYLFILIYLFTPE